MTHGDDKGLRLPPKIAPIQVVIIPITKNEGEKSDVKSYLDSTLESLKNSGVRIYVDWTDNTPVYYLSNLHRSLHHYFLGIQELNLNRISHHFFHLHSLLLV